MSEVDVKNVTSVSSEFFPDVQEKVKKEASKNPALVEDKKSQKSYLNAKSFVKGPQLYVTKEMLINKIDAYFNSLSPEEQTEILNKLYPVAKGVTDTVQQPEEEKSTSTTKPLPENIYFAICQVFTQSMNLQGQDELTEVNIMDLQNQLMEIEQQELRNLAALSSNVSGGNLPVYKQDVYDEKGNLIHKKGDVAENSDIQCYDKDGNLLDTKDAINDNPHNTPWGKIIFGVVMGAVLIGASAFGVGFAVREVKQGLKIAEAAVKAAKKVASPALMGTVGALSVGSVVGSNSQKNYETKNAQFLKAKGDAVNTQCGIINNNIQLATKRMSDDSTKTQAVANYIQQAIMGLGQIMSGMQRA